MTLYGTLVDNSTILEAWGLGGVMFLAVFWATYCQHRQKVFEVTFLRALVVWARAMVLIEIILLLPLTKLAAAKIQPLPTPTTSFGTGTSYNWGWGRPSVGGLLIGIGFFLEYHPLLRWICIFGLLGELAVDTVSYYDLETEIGCIQRAKCVVTEGFTLQSLGWWAARDLGGMVTAVCGLLLMLYLTSAIGACHTRYTYRQLNAGMFNRVRVMRLELRKLGFPRLRQRPQQGSLRQGGTANTLDMSGLPLFEDNKGHAEHKAG